MHEIISTIVSFFLSPFNWVIILVIAGLLFKKKTRRKTCFIVAFCIFLLFGNKWLLETYAKNWQPAPVVLNPGKVYSCGIVAGGFASPDAHAHGYFNSTADRFIQIMKLYKTGKIKNIMISGGNGKPDENSFREGAWVKGQLVQMGVPESVIFLEDQSTNTAENAINSKHILDSLKFAPPYLLVTSAYHMQRASLIFQKAGLDVIPFPCNYTDGRGGTDAWDFIPRPSVLMGWDTYLKETVGYYWYKMKGDGNGE
jgi:uncharacterized SAM-binding protein YcdF (DUF218 family)